MSKKSFIYSLAILSSVIEMAEDVKKKFLEKHEPLTEEEVAETSKTATQTQEKYTYDMQKIEANLLGFLERPEPVRDPETNEIILVMRRPYFEELKKMLPPEIAEAVNNPDVKVSQEKLEEYDKQFFGIIKDLVVAPAKDAEWWRTHFNGKLAKLIREELVKMLSDMGIEMENFQEARKGIS